MISALIKPSGYLAFLAHDAGSNGRDFVAKSRHCAENFETLLRVLFDGAVSLAESA